MSYTLMVKSCWLIYKHFSIYPLIRLLNWFCFIKSVLDDKKSSKALIKNSVEKLSGNKRLYIFSDHSDSRKPYSKKLENLGKVRDLNGNI